MAQGYDARGHTGDIETFSLLPQVVHTVSPTLVLDAGGVFDGRRIAAALINPLSHKLPSLVEL